MHPHDRFARACGALPPSYRKLRCGAGWLLIGLALVAFVWMLGNCQQADQRAEVVAQGGQ